MNRQLTKIFLLLFLATVQINCSKAKFQRVPAEGGDTSVVVLRNNGGGYPGAIFNERQSALCEGQFTNIRTAIGFIESQQQFWLVREDCREITPVLLAAHEVEFANDEKSEINFKGRRLTTEDDSSDTLDLLISLLDLFDEI